MRHPTPLDLPLSAAAATAHTIRPAPPVTRMSGFQAIAGAVAADRAAAAGA